MEKVFLVIEHGLDHPGCEKKVAAVCTTRSKANKIKSRNRLYRMVKPVPLNEKINY